MKKMSVNLILLVAILLIGASARAATFAVYDACKTAGTDLYVKKFKDTKKNEINFINTGSGCEIEIKSDDSGSMLVRRVLLGSAKYKYINFEFKAANIIEAANLKKKKGDDAPARLYVFFEYEPDKAGFFEKAYRKYSGNKTDGRAIVYVYGSNVKKGEVFENPYSDQFIQIIVEAGKERLNEYVKVRRNVYEDYKEYFKETPPKNISSISIMTDTDQTGGTATGYFRNVFLSDM